MDEDERDSVKVFKIEIMFIDFDQLGEEEIRLLIENTHYPNHIIAPSVSKMESIEVEWSDDHPLNNSRTWKRAFNELFRLGRWK